MATAVTTTSGHVARALRFYNLCLTSPTNMFVGIAVTGVWDDEASPPAADPTTLNLGRIYATSYHNSSMTTVNTYVSLTSTPFLGGVVAYKVLALSATTFEIRKISDNSLVASGGSPYTASNTPFTTLIPGISLTVKGTTMVAGDYFLFTVDGQIGFKVFDTYHLVVPDDSGTITFRGQKYLIVAPEDAYTSGARFVYIEANLQYDELPIQPFRQIGVYTGLTRADGVSTSKQNLLVSEVADCGALEIIDNRTPVYRDISQKDVLRLIVEH